MRGHGEILLLNFLVQYSLNLTFLHASVAIADRGFLQKTHELCASTQLMQWHSIPVMSNMHVKSTQVKATLLVSSHITWAHELMTSVQFVYSHDSRLYSALYLLQVVKLQVTISNT